MLLPLREDGFISSHMKTSIDIDDQLYRRARIRAVEQRTTLRALVEAGLKAVLGEGPTETEAERIERRMQAIIRCQERFAAAGGSNGLTDEEILGYDENGLPT